MKSLSNWQILHILTGCSPAFHLQVPVSDPSRAGVIIPVEQEENEDLLMLLMPMMLND